MKAIPLTVPFKGERNYIHSTDVYVDILRGLEEHERNPESSTLAHRLTGKRRRG